MKTKLLRLHYNNLLIKYFKIKKNLFVIAEKILLIQDVEKYKKNIFKVIMSVSV